MAEHFEDALISVWQQTLVQNAKTVELGADTISSSELRGTAFVRSTSCSMDKDCGALSRIPRLARAGLNWLVKARRSCSS
jgi:hypothetical protein